MNNDTPAERGAMITAYESGNHLKENNHGE